jgi:hypothetical protein
MGKLCLETRFFGSDDPGPLEEHPSLKDFRLVLAYVIVNVSLMRRTK